MNKGRAVSVQLEEEPQIVTDMASPAGRLLNNCMPTQATPDNERPIQTPLPKMTNSVKTSKAVMKRSFMFIRCEVLHLTAQILVCLSIPG